MMIGLSLALGGAVYARRYAKKAETKTEPTEVSAVPATVEPALA
jgi:hypothetical protein